MELVPIVKGSAFVVKQLMQVESVTEVLQTWLSMLPIEEGSVQKIIATLQGENAYINKQLDQVNQKLDRILDGPAKKCALHLNEALLSFNFDKKEDGDNLMNLASEAAKDAFNYADSYEGWVASTNLRVLSALLKIQHDDFARMSSLDMQRLAATYKLHVNDLHEKIEAKKAQDIKEAENANPLIKNVKRKEVMKRFELYDIEEGKILKSVYGMMSEGFGWTDPRKRIPITQDHLKFEVMPQYIPVGEKNMAYILVKQEPQILVTAYRKRKYSRDKVYKTEVTLFWAIDDEKHEAILPSASLELEPYPITIQKAKLDEFRRGGMKLGTTRKFSLNPRFSPQQKNASTSNLRSLAHQSISEAGEPSSKPSQGIQLPQCAICRQSLNGEKVEALGLAFHSSCFNCCQCGCNLSGDDDHFKADQSKAIHCFPCYNKKFGKVCYGCQNVISVIGGPSSQILNAGGRTYHPDCYRCEDCGIKLGPGGEKCYPKNDKFLCSNCAS